MRFFLNQVKKNLSKLRKLSRGNKLSVYYVTTGGRIFEFSGVLITPVSSSKSVVVYNPKFKTTFQFALTSPLIIFIKIKF